MQEWVRQQSFFLFFIAWLLLFFPKWYTLSYTKVRELQSMLLEPREVQLQVLHPAGEMTQLLELRAVLRTQFSGKKVAILRPVQMPNIPLSTDASMLRAVLYPIPVLDTEQLTDEEIVLVIQDRSQAEDCTEKSEAPHSFAGEVICWPIL